MDVELRHLRYTLSSPPRLALSHGQPLRTVIASGTSAHPTAAAGRKFKTLVLK
jgi:hypothetical protein